MNILTISPFKEEIKQYLLKHYPHTVFSNYYSDYLLLLQEMIFKMSEDYSDYNRHIINSVLSNKAKYQMKSLIKDYQFNLPSAEIRKKFNKTILTRHIKNLHPRAANKRNVYLVDIMKQDLIAMNILVEEHNVQHIQTKYQPTYTRKIYSINLHRPISLFEEEVIKFEVTGEFEQHPTSDFVFDLDELMELINDVPLRKFIRNYHLMMKLNKDGFKIKSIGKADRIFHNASYLSKEFRSILKVRESGNHVVGRDLKSSFPFFLAILDKNEQLYADIVTDEIKTLFDKIELLSWFNDKKYMSKKYEEVRSLFTERYGIDTSTYRDKEGCMYSSLAQMESDYISSVVDQLHCKYFTIHDEIYVDSAHLKQLSEAIQSAGNNMHFKPIWK